MDRFSSGLVSLIACWGAALPAPAAAMTLSEAVLLASKRSPAIAEACDGVREARFGRDLAASEFSVQFAPRAESGLATDTQTSQRTVLSLTKKFRNGAAVDLSAGSTVTDEDFYRSFSGVTVTQSVFQPFADSAQGVRLEEADDEIAARRRRAALVRDRVVVRVVDAFYRIQGQREVVGLLERAVERALHRVEAAEARLERGLATRMDAYRAESHVAETRGDLLDARESLKTSTDELRLVLDWDENEPIDPEAELVSIPKLPAGADPAAIAFDHRLEIDEAEARIADSRRALELARRETRPDLRVGVNFAMSGTGADLERSFDFDDSGVRFLLSGSNPLDRSASRARTGQARIALRRQERERQRIEREIASEVRQAARQRDTTARRIEIAERGIAASRSNLDLATLRFERGYADMLDLVEAEDRLLASETELVRLRIDDIRASVRLLEAAGRVDALVESLLGAAAPELCEENA